MTDTAYVIALMEAATSPEEQASAQARYPTDMVFRDVLTLTYDPYEQFGTPLGLEDPEQVVEIDEINEALDADWTEIAGALRTGVRYAEAVKRWRLHGAWPVVDRVLRKRFTGVSFATANGVWGTIPLFDAGDVGDGEVTYPCVAVPVYSRHRRLVVVRPVTYLPDARARVDIFDRFGQCQEMVVGDVLPRRLRRIDWDPFFEQESCVSGIVLDGWIDDATDTFSAFDCVPLSRFREQKMTAPYLVRSSVFETLEEMSHEGLMYGDDESEQTIPWLEDQSDWEDHQHQLCAVADGRGVIGVNPEAPYPYRPSHAWSWLKRP